MDERRQITFVDLISIASFLLGLENLQENRDQSAHNDVQEANTKQAEYLLNELSQKFEEQNEMLRKILEVTDNANANRKEQSETA